MRALTTIFVSLITSATALAIDHGAPPPCNDRRWDAVGAIVQIPPGTPQPCEYYHNGSCVLIAPNVVLTARHTVKIGAATVPVETLGPTDPVIHRVRFRRGTGGGENNTFTGYAPTDCMGEYQEFDVWKYEFLSKNTSAPDGADNLFDSDLALLHLRTPVDGSGNYLPVPMITPLRVASYNRLYQNSLDIAPGNVWIAGWGRVGGCLNQGQWQFRTAKLGRMIDPLTDESDFRTPQQTNLWGRISWPRVTGTGEFFTLRSGACNSTTFEQAAPSSSIIVGSSYRASLDMGLVSDWENMPAGNMHDSGGAILVEVPVPGGGSELRVVAVITVRDGGVRVDNWNLWRWNHRLESSLTELTIDNSTTGLAACSADFNRDGVVDSYDMYGSTGFWTAFSSGKCIADMDNNSTVNIDDLFVFVGLTCP